MTQKITKLSEKLIKQIAAGEVIAKPYNAIKELIENSIDAKSTKVQIFLSEYGMRSIVILDNGIGIKKDDLILAKQIHTTSKTRESDEFFGISSFGFRGEALASIDAVSNLIIESNGYKLEQGVISSSLIEHGTKITINNIFQNIPARLKFIKNPQNELKAIKFLIKQLIIQNNNIEWRLTINEKLIWNIKSNAREKIIEELLKEEPIIKKECSKNTKITAYILKKQPNISIIYANKRPIKDKAILKYIASLFKEYTFIHENPGYIVDIEIDPLYIDCNVHPAKEEVRFLNYTELFHLLNSIFSMHQLSENLNPHIIFNNQKTTEMLFHNTPNNIKMVCENDQKPIKTQQFLSKNDLFFAQQTVNEIKNNKTFTSPLQHDETPVFKIIGQLQNSYILFETENGLGIFDQHAAHERKIYEEMKTEFNEKSSKMLLIPSNLRLSNDQQVFIEENKEKFTKKGIVIQGNQLIALPPILQNIADLVMRLETLSPPFDIETEVDRLLANIACKKALKANTPLSPYQMHTLLQSALISPPICNHGRPVFKYFSNHEIQSFFKRT